MTNEELDLIEARANAATPGPWELDSDAGLIAIDIDSRGEKYIRGIVEAWNENDRHFIAHARSDLPALIAEVRRLKTELQQER